MRTFLAMACVLVIAPFAFSAEAAFASKPEVVREGNSLRIRFAAAKATDVEVAILNAKGDVVRHLAAGVLGANAPAPLQKDSLTQALTWDGHGDDGKPAGGGPFRVRVGLGLAPSLKGFLGNNPAALQSVRGIAVGPTGELFVTHVFGELHPSDGTPSVVVFDRQGKYLRTIYPWASDTPEGKLHEVKQITREDGKRVPFLYQAETRSYLPGAGDLPPHQPVVTKDGRFAFVGILEGPHRYAQAGVNHLITLRTDGGVPENGAIGHVVAKNTTSGANLALSPDEQTLYASGVKAGNFAGKPTHAIFAFGWKDREPRVFAGTLGMSGKSDKELHTPRGIAVDGSGNVYVADRENHRIAIFQPDGKFLGDLACNRPERVAVHPKSGAVYVLGGESVNIVQKFASWKDAKSVAEAKLPTFKHPEYTALMALDATGDKPVLWLASPKGYYAKFDLIRIEDNGTGFGKLIDVGKENAVASPAAGAILGMDYDRVHRRLLVGTKAYDVAAEKWVPGIRESSGKSTDSAGVGSFGLDGNFYSQIYPKTVRRLGGDLKKLPFEAAAATKGDLQGPFKEGTLRVRGRGICADQHGNVYALWEDGDHFTRGEAFNQLYVHNPDGSIKKADLVAGRIRSLNSVRVDSSGNVYLALGLRPGTDLLPPSLKGKVPDSAKDADAVGTLNSYPLIYGSIVKFGPEGGAVMPDCGGAKCNYAFGKPMEVKGAKWIYSGTSPVVSWRTPGTPDICNCESPRFDVDAFGRSFFPDAAQCRVGVLDTNGNLVGWFGEYGNVDARAPAIPMQWPYCISVGDGEAFVGDRLNRQVLRVALGHLASEIVAVP